MKQPFLIMMLLALLNSMPVQAADQSLSDYLSGYDYAARKAMKIDREALVRMLSEGKVQLVD